MARVHVTSWQQTYRGLMRDEVLDDPDFVTRREAMWRRSLTDPQYADRQTAVLEHDGDLVGIAMTAPPGDDDATWSRQLYVLYVLAEHHGSGAARSLVEAVLPPDTSAALWVADPNPRAQAFYAKLGFRPDGTDLVDDGVREIRMVRS
ncbi:GNAT family N-acetyltransferase [Calidifontibacter sp. DB0510]|uniref:GNAT family N-acetyltransferase n=1 Tax=Metallococcus carri TaxID=1656884 RepID=A0A967B031_9MICO|nr:GNAT family N-acetyltransferase [Metallococcus carri]NHN54775.1 GNAT family N-acetyltransferase [Metallococcus carri]NOP37120.1 GNAT family N-acetyltransferase [Calidifontibacter sp. DB2511S]